MTDNSSHQSTGARRGLVIFVGAAEQQTRDALAGLGLQVAEIDAADAERGERITGGSLIVLDAERDSETVRRMVAEPTSHPVLVLLPRGTALGEVVEDRGQVTWLSRPFSPETLAALALHTLRRADMSAPPAGIDTEVRGRPPRPLAPNSLYQESRTFVAEALAAVRAGQAPDLSGLRRLAEEIHTDLVRHNALVNRSLEPHDAFDLASHCVNVGIIAGKIGRGLALTIEDVLRVIQAGLVHDIGMARLDESILEKSGALEEDEWTALRQHPVYGAEVLEGLGRDFSWLRTAVLQEHERARGQGYPSGLIASQIDPAAVILGVADVFEALAHPRAYRSPFTGLEALETVAGMQDEYFPVAVVAALVNEISAFPLDSHVQLSSGEIARVVATNPVNLLRPTVDVLWDSSWSPVAKPVRIDLADRPDLTVARALLDADLPLT